MFPRLVFESFRRQRRRKTLAVVAVTLGMAVVTAMLAVSTDIGDKMNRELRSYGANLVVYPQEDTLDVKIGGVDLKPASDGAYLNEADLKKIKGIFWAHNIVGFAPMLRAQAQIFRNGRREDTQIVGTYFAKSMAYGKESYTTGVRTTHPWWKVSGAWPHDDSDEALAGDKVGLHTGDTVKLGDRTMKIVGVLTSGGEEDNALVVPLIRAQELIGRPGAVRRVLVSALTKPEDDFGRRDPKTMSGATYDRWYCSPYANSIALQLTEAIPNSRAEQIRQVAQNEGTVLSRITGLMLLVSLAALLASILAVSSAMATAILERRREIGVMTALGASKGAVVAIFAAEAALLALLGGMLGYALGALLAQQVARTIFGSSIATQPVLFPIVMALAVAVTCLGSAGAIRRATRMEPAIVLRGDV